jgi:hypothetical protein
VSLNWKIKLERHHGYGIIMVVNRDKKMNRWSDLKKRSMSRKEFLKIAGIGVLVLANLDVFLKLFGSSHGSNSNHAVADGYGSQGYSGFIDKQPSKGRGYFS